MGICIDRRYPDRNRAPPDGCFCAPVADRQQRQRAASRPQRRRRIGRKPLQRRGGKRGLCRRITAGTATHGQSRARRLARNPRPRPGDQGTRTGGVRIRVGSRRVSRRKPGTPASRQIRWSKDDNARPRLSPGYAMFSRRAPAKAGAHHRPQRIRATAASPASSDDGPLPPQGHSLTASPSTSHSPNPQPP